MFGLEMLRMTYQDKRTTEKKRTKRHKVRKINTIANEIQAPPLVPKNLQNIGRGACI